mgnify:CR=1 FL=1
MNKNIAVGKHITKGGNMFKPTAIYYEKNIENYTLGKELLV